MLVTRFSNSFGWQIPPGNCGGVLVRIHPEQGIGEPFSLGLAPGEVGRESTEILLSDDSVSRRHAAFHWNGKTHVITDLDSTNGTFVNEERIVSRELIAGDRVRFGKQLFKYLDASGIETTFHEVIFKIMTTDGLTETHNRAYLSQTLERELQLITRTGLPLSLMMLDIDFFKKINDTYGHLAGDEVLRQFARRVKAMIRRGDLLARYGGEEFAVLCPQTDLPDALRLAERICAETRAQPVLFESGAIPVTVSIGLVGGADSFRAPTHDIQPDWHTLATELLARADQYLYRAKHSGRNRVCWPVPSAVAD